MNHFEQSGGHNLPGNAVFVFEPAALLCLCIPALRKLLPVIVHFFLRLATDLERDRLVECEHWATVECGKGVSIQFKCHRHDRSRRSSVDFIPCFSIPSNADDLRIVKDGGVKLRHLFGLIIKPQTWGDLLHVLHGVSPRRVSSRLRMTVTTY